MPPGQAYDLMLDGQGYLLERGKDDKSGPSKRAWRVTSRYASLAQQEALSQRYNQQHPLVEAMQVWADLASGYGDDEQLIPGRYRYTENVDCRFRGQIIPGPKVTPIAVPTATDKASCWAEINGRLFFAAGRYVFEIDTIDGTATQRQDLGSGAVAVAMVTFGGQLYVSLGLTRPFWVMTPGATAAQDVWEAAGSGMVASYWAVVRNVLWAARDTAAIRALSEGANPLTPDSWGASYPIGDSKMAITALSAQGDYLYVGKENGLHVVDADYEGVAVTPELSTAVDQHNGKNMTAWHGKWYVPYVRGLLSYYASESGHVIGSATPYAAAGMDNPVRGRVVAMVGDDQWLYALLADPEGNTWLLAGREATGTESEYVGAMLWHTLAMLTGVEGASLHLTGLFTNPRLYIGWEKAVGYVVLPRYSANPLQDSNYRYALTGSIYLPSFDLYAPETPKLWRAVAIEADELTLARYVDVYFRLDHKGSWEYVGRANTAPKHILALPAYGQAGHSIELRLDLAIPADSSPIRIRRVLLYGAERPEAIEQIACVIRCADRLPTRSGGLCPRSAEEIRRTLRKLGNESRSVVLVDPIGVQRRVIVQAGIAEEEAEQEGGQPREMLLTVYMTPFETDETPAATGNLFIVGSSVFDGPDVLA